ncbi:MAG: carbohydrate ABC transporter permease [Oscillospiraceae bacterium]|jgi:putative aldouronate transport system permease protein|nr:carbohydrate ABC transporter permease [Oscillospiraceae bacterium]
MTSGTARRHSRRIGKSLGEIVFDRFNEILLGVIALSMLYPFWYLFAVSLADAQRVALSKVYLWPPILSLESYKNVLGTRYIYYSFGWTILRTVGGTLVALLLGLNLAYVLSKKYYPNRSFWTGVLVFTMFFSGGIIPEYLLIKDLGLIDSVWSLMLPGAISAYNIVIMRNYLMTMPDSLEESAKLDGANDVLILYRIILPLSMPILATVGLWTAVGHWNAWFDAMIYIRSTEKQVLQLILRRVVLMGDASIIPLSGEEVTNNLQMNTETIKAATVMVATIPILIVYPFIQKYFVKGIMIGSLKG